MKRGLAILLASFPAVAQEVPDAPAGIVAPPPGTAFCYPALRYCIVNVADYVEGAKCVDQAPKTIKELRERAGTVQCARLEVTEPSRAKRG